jgi:hypothetical protein
MLSASFKYEEIRVRVSRNEYYEKMVLASEHDSAFTRGHIAAHDIKVMQQPTTVMVNAKV